MKLRFKKPNYSRKGDTTYCTVICIIEMNNTDFEMQNSIHGKYKTQCADPDKMFENFTFKESDYKRCLYEAVSIGKAVKSPIDTDNPRLAERLAEARARLNCYKYAETVSNIKFHYLKELAFGNLLVTTNCPESTSNGGLYDQWLYYQSLVEKEKYYISKLLSEL